MMGVPVKYLGFDHIKWWVGNAKQAADWYIARFGFERVAYKGLETGERVCSSHVIRLNEIIWEFSSPYTPNPSSEMAVEIGTHGDGVKDVALRVENCRAAFDFAKSRGATVVSEPTELKDADGVAVVATIKTYGDTYHSFVERSNYRGAFLPGYSSVSEKSAFSDFTPPTKIEVVDHCVGNQPENQMSAVVEWYEGVLDFERFWTVDDKTIHTKYSSLRSTVMASKDRTIKLPINEPANGLKKSQIQEYVDFYGGAGVQHIALRTEDIIYSISQLKKRGVTFLSVPNEYYENLLQKLSKSPITVKEDLKTIQELGILVDFDEKGYLLQIFTHPCQDRPTLFIEIIQRRKHEGFGAGNFKALFEAIERAQALRGSL